MKKHSPRKNQEEFVKTAGLDMLINWNQSKAYRYSAWSSESLKSRGPLEKKYISGDTIKEAHTLRWLLEWITTKDNCIYITKTSSSFQFEIDAPINSLKLRLKSSIPGQISWQIKQNMLICVCQ